MGSKLITKDLVAAGDWDGITEKVSSVVKTIRKLKG